MKRPEGFDDRPARPAQPTRDRSARPAAGDATGSERSRTATVRSWLRRPTAEPTADTAGGDADTAAPGADTTAGPSAEPGGPGDDTDRAGGTARGGDTPTPGRDVGAEAAPDLQGGTTTGVAGSTGQRVGAGLSALAARFRQLSPDEDFVDPVARERAEERARRAAEARAAGTSPADRGSVGDDGPVDARTRAAETARAARAARRERRLVERQEVRRFTRRSRHRRAAWTTAGAVVVVLVVSVLVAVYSPLMALRTIEVRGTDRVDRAQVLRAVDGQLGTPLARVDFGAIKRELGGFPLIASYVTEEAPPHTLVITVTEREPVVAVKTGSGYELVDPAGVVVESDPKQPAGVPLAAVSSAQIGGSAYRAMTAVVLSLPASVRSVVTQVSATTADDVTLHLSSGAAVVWGSPDSSPAKATLLAALMKAQAPTAKVEYDVSAPDNGIVRQQH